MYLHGDESLNYEICMNREVITGESVWQKASLQIFSILPLEAAVVGDIWFQMVLQNVQIHIFRNFK